MLTPELAASRRISKHGKRRLRLHRFSSLSLFCVPLALSPPPRANTHPGGSLKLKGTKDGGIKKKKKKSRDKSLTRAKSEDPESERAHSAAAEEGGPDKAKGKERSSREGSPVQDDDADGPEKGDYYAGKTEAERRFEERKRKRVGSFCGAGFGGIGGLTVRLARWMRD